MRRAVMAARAACGSITINSGTVIAQGGGVRGSMGYFHGIDGGVITISGGTVNSANTNWGGVGADIKLEKGYPIHGFI